ncbi:MAG: hypothetical protein WA137_07300 [Methanothrix sp.]
MSTTIAMYAGTEVILIDRKTGKIIKRVPLDKIPMFAKNVEVLTAATNLLASTEGMEQFKELNVQAAKALSSSLKAAEIAAGELTKV